MWEEFPEGILSNGTESSAQHLQPELRRRWPHIRSPQLLLKGFLHHESVVLWISLLSANSAIFEVPEFRVFI